MKPQLVAICAELDKARKKSLEIEGCALLPEHVGANVIYIPNHANGNINHPDCEFGIISSWNDKVIFVKYINSRFRVGESEATTPEDLRWN